MRIITNCKRINGLKVEIIDVWAMTVTEYPVIFETTEELDYRVLIYIIGE